MVKINNAFGDSYSGQAAKAGVFAHWKGRQYRRRYVVPSNPNTTMQQVVRGFFTNAVDMWHTFQSLRRRAFSYLATGQVMSGFNLFVKRYQLAATAGATLPLAPLQGIKQIASASASKQQTSVTGTSPVELDFAPVRIGSCTYTPVDGDTIEQDAYVDLDMGDVRIPVELAKVDGRKGLGAALAPGDMLAISYTSGGRTVSREVLYTVPDGAAVIPAKAAIADAFRTAFYPIDLQSVVMEIWDESENEWISEPLESMEILNLDYEMVEGVAVPHAYVFFDNTSPTDTDSHVDWTSYTPINGAKLEVTKADTTFVSWRDYSTPVGAIPIAQTSEDEAYDFALTAANKTSVIRAAQSALLTTKHELITMSAA